MSIKSNLYYSALLTFSTYLVPLLVFPYISRVLGAESIGAIDTVDNIIDYSILFSMMGMSTLGIREVAKSKSDPKALQATFNDLFALNAISTGIVFLLIVLATILLPAMHGRIDLLAIGGIKLLANLFWIEWLYRGLENFKYITLRSIVVRVLFIVSVYIFVRQQHDYIIYYALFVGVVVLNAICNWTHKKSIVSLQWRNCNLKKYVKPFIVLGLFAMLSAVYTKLSMPVLSFTCSDQDAGYYATATRMYQVIIALISSLISAIIPRMSVLIKEGKTAEIERMTKMAFQLLFFIAFPVIIFMELFTPDIILLFAGKGFEQAITPMRIVMIQVLVIGTEQIFILQLLIPLKRDKWVVYSGVAGVAVWAILSAILVPRFHAIGSAIVWVSAELTVLVCASFEVKRVLGFTFPWGYFRKGILIALPYIGFCILSKMVFANVLFQLGGASVLFLIYAAFLWKRVKL